MRRRVFMLGVALSLTLCVVTGERWLSTSRINIDSDPTGPGIVLVHSVPWLGWMCVVFAVTTAGLVWRLVHYMRLSDFREYKGLCQSCGYDLRATSDQCPECGAIPDDNGEA